MYGHFCCEAVLACTFMYLHAFTGTRGGAATGGGTGAAGRPAASPARPGRAHHADAAAGLDARADGAGPDASPRRRHAATSHLRSARRLLVHQ